MLPERAVNLDALRAVADRWREEAAVYERDGVLGHAAVLRRLASELEAVLAEWWVEPLGIEEAADEVGCAYEAMAKRIRRGSLPNAGEKGRPLVRRCDLFGGNGPKRKSDPASLDMANEILRIHEMR